MRNNSAYMNRAIQYTLRYFQSRLRLCCACLIFTDFAIAQENTSQLGQNFSENHAATDNDALTLNLIDVLRSTFKHHPKVIEATSAVDEKRALEQASQGAFDWYAKQDSFGRGSGYYDGRFFDQKLSRRLQNFNAELSFGYRVSDGDFPVYEQQHQTLDDGEAYLKLKLSLLQGRSIDEDRAGLFDASVNVQLAELDQQLNINVLLFDAAIVYLSWYRANAEEKIAQQALQLAENRKEAIRLGVEKGDLAKITLSEFEHSLLNRKITLLSSQQKKAALSIELGLYQRDHSGRVLDLSRYRAPSNIFESATERGLNVAVEDAITLSALNQHPSYQQLAQELERQKNKLRLNENKYLPKLDLELVAAEDIGSGSETLMGTESYVGLSFSVPLERREAKGKISAQKEKLRQTRQKQILFTEKYSAELNKAKLDLVNLQDLERIRKEQARLSLHLIEQEERRFEAGDSDLFLLNSRERQAIQAQMSALDAEIKIIQQKLYILSLSADIADWIQ